MNLATVSSAQRTASDLLAVDHEKVIKLLTLRAAQVKYLLNRTAEGEKSLDDHLREQLLPPVNQSGDALIQFGLSAHEKFTREIRPVLIRKALPSRENESWLNELDNVFLEMRRVVMQNLSKHPALRPHNLLTKLRDALDQQKVFEQEYSELVQYKAGVSRHLIQVDRDMAECCLQPGFDTLRLLDESLEKLVVEKRARSETWMECWQPLREIFKRLAENENAAGELENAQHRMLHLYLSNPLLTRERDAHGLGLVMILRVAVSALETRKKMFKGMSNEDVRTTLLNALENPFFIHFQEQMHALDAAITANQHERSIHPHHRMLSELQQRANELLREHEKVVEAIYQITQQKESNQIQIQSAWKDANAACQTQLNFELEKMDV